MTDVVLVQAVTSTNVVLVHRWDGVVVVTLPASPQVVLLLTPSSTVVFPDADPHVAGAAYWVGGVLTRSNG